MSFGFTDGAYNRASGTLNAFGALSADLEREGHPPMVSRSGDREPADELRIWHERMVLYPDINGRHVYARVQWQGKTWYRIHPDTVATPGSSNHGKRRSNDLRYPYNSTATAAHRRAQKLAPDHGITCEGLNFGEAWHWTFWGALGTIGAPASSGSSTFNPASILEDTMSTNPIINVIDAYRGPEAWKNGRIMVGLDDGSFEESNAVHASNVRGILGKIFFGGNGEQQDLIPTLSQDDFNVVKAQWAQMCKGRTDAAAVWAEGIHAQNADGQPLFVDKAGRISTDPAGEPLKFNAAGFIASTNALAHTIAE